MDHPWMDTLPTPLCLSIRGCQSYCAIHGPSMDEHLTTPLCLSICGCQSYCAIYGPSMDGHLAYPPLSTYPWMSQNLLLGDKRPDIPGMLNMPSFLYRMCKKWICWPLILTRSSCKIYNGIPCTSVDRSSCCGKTDYLLL